jgi:hypothetical protein
MGAELGEGGRLTGLVDLARDGGVDAVKNARHADEQRRPQRPDVVDELVGVALR